MNRVAALVSAAGIDPRQEAAETAALMVRRFPLRIGGPEQGKVEEIVEGGWCSGLSAFSELIALVSSRPHRWGGAFGERWPWFEVGSTVVAPGLPVRVGLGREELGPDGVYTFDGETLYREAAGRRQVFLETDSSASPTTPEFTLLWFSDDARYLLRDTVLEIEDLFSKTRCSVDKERMEKILIRGQRVDGEVIEGLLFDPGPQPTTVEVAREWGEATAPWQDPAAFLESRIDVEQATTVGDRTVIRDIRGETVEFRVTDHKSGWRLERTQGQFPFEALSLQKEGEHRVLEATLAPKHDIFSPGLRGRVVFDLNADLRAWPENPDTARCERHGSGFEAP